MKVYLVNWLSSPLAVFSTKRKATKYATQLIHDRGYHKLDIVEIKLDKPEAKARTHPVWRTPDNIVEADKLLQAHRNNRR